MSDDMQSKFTATINQFMHKIIAMDRAEKYCYGVTLSQANTIGIINKKQNLTMNELSQDLNLALSTLTRIVDILVRDSIICRNPDPQDRRKVCLGLTEKGRDLAQKLQSCSEQFWARIFQALPADKQAQISADLELLCTTMKKVESVCCPKR